MSTYSIDFKNAIDRSNKFGLDIPKINFDKKSYLNPNTMETIQKLLHQAQLKPQDISKQCFRLHADIKVPLEVLFGTEIYFTIGYITIHDNEYFKISEQDIDYLLKNKVTSTLSAHAWLTLTSMEIIDLTFASTYLILTNEFKGEMHVIAKHTDKLTQGMKYHPMIVGTDFLFKIGAVQGNPTWKK
jgi:hypothetical protein